MSANPLERVFLEALTPLREQILAHGLYAGLRDESSIRIFMRSHVFAVWDFQSLLKGLQRCLTCVELPWLPTADPQARRLSNEIVLDEESDEAPGGGYLSHFELYLDAMRACGADAQPIDRLISALRGGSTIDAALAQLPLPDGVAAFVSATMNIARSAQAHRIAAAFAYGREEITPAMFVQLAHRLAGRSPANWSTFSYYLDRHIHTDRDRHGPQSQLLLRRLCGDDARLWQEASEAACASLGARIRFWDAIAAALET